MVRLNLWTEIMSLNAGTIEYTVSVETQQSIDAANKINQSLDKTEKQMKSTDTESGKLGGGMKKLAADIKRANSESSATTRQFSRMGKVIGAIIGTLATKVIIQMADEFTEMSSRLKQVAIDTDEYEKVQARLLQTANNTYRPLAEAAEVYIRTSKAIKDLGYNTDQVLDITDSFSYLLVTNAASSDRATSAINAYSKAIQTGKVSSETWQSILAAMPSVVEDIANATGSTESAIRQLGIEGKLSLEALNEALLRSKDKNLELADAMDTTVGDAVVAFKNSLQVFIGKVNESTGATSGLAGAIGTMSEALQDPATIAAAQNLASGVIIAFTTMIEFLRETVAVVEWAAESMAAAMHGPALDDVVRMTDEIESLEQQAKNTREEMDKMRLLRINPFKSDAEYQAQYDDLLRKIAFYKQAVEDAQKAKLPQPEVKSPDAPKPENVAPAALVAAAAIGKQTKARKGLTEAQREAQREAKKLEDAERSNLGIIEKLSEAIYQTGLNSKELAQRQAELQLNKYATPEQIEQVRALSGALSEINDLMKRKAEFDKGVGSTIRGDVPVLQGGGFDDGTARYEAEAAAERQRYAEQLERMQEAEELKLEVAGGYDLMREQLYQEHSDRMAEIDRVRTEMQLTQWAQGFGDMSKNLADFANTFAKENKAMFAVSKAAAIAQAVINTYQAATGAMSAMSAIPIVGPALGIVAAAAAVAGGLAQVANIRSQTMGGGRRYGGAVNDNKYYRVNEDGRPEIFKGADGSQYMMPNQRGEVVSHDDAIGGQQRSGNTVNVTQNITMRSDNGNYTAKQVMLESSRRQSIAEARLG